jgi:hypothetical protein
MVRFILNNEGVLYRESTSTTLISGDFKKAICDELLASEIRMSPVLSSTQLGDFRLMLPLSGDIRYGIIKMNAINFNANWQVRTDVTTVQTILQPDMVNPGATFSPLEGNQKLLWQIPEWLPTFFFADLMSFRGGMVSFYRNNGETYHKIRLPVPNQWKDTRLCFDIPEEDKEELHRKPALDKLTAFYNAWVNSKWNYDLYLDAFTSVFKWTAEGEQIAISNDTVTNFCQPLQDVPTDIIMVHKAIEALLTES